MHKTGDRIVTLWGDGINAYETRNLRKKFEEMVIKDREQWITFELMSEGGRCDAGFALFDWLQVNVPQLQTVAYGPVNSMAVILFAAGHNRVATKRSSFYLHPVQNNYAKEATLDERQHKNAAAALQKTQGVYLEVLIEQIGSKSMKKKDREQLKRDLKQMMDECTTLSVKKALEIGLVHEIV